MGIGHASPRGILTAIIIFGFGLITFAEGAFARLQKVPNSYVVLDLPDSFKPQDRYAGFVSKEAGAQIMVLDLPRTAYSQFETDFEKDLANKGYTDVRREKLDERGDDHIFFYARQRTPVGQFDKYLLIFRNAVRAAYVTITVNPVEKVQRPLSYIEARQILAKIKLSDEKEKETLSYSLAFKGPFRARNTIIGSTTLFELKEDAARNDQKETKGKVKTDNEAESKPMFVVSPSLTRIPIDDLKSLSREMMKKFTRLKDMKLEADEEVTIAKMKGYGLAGSALRKTTDKPVGVYQLVLAHPEGGYYRLIGIAPKDEFEHYLPIFRRMAASFSLTKK